MIIAMFLAHLVGDYILQWDNLAAWKSREIKGVLVHSGIVFAVTWALAAVFDPFWWQGVVFIGAMHLLIDVSQLKFDFGLPPMVRFFGDQLAHLVVIVIALDFGGYLSFSSIVSDLATVLHSERLWVYLLGYAFVTMPAWVLIKFLAYGLLKGTAPEFDDNHKYAGILERLLITTLVATGQILLAPLVVVPRFVLDFSQIGRSRNNEVYLFELLTSLALAIAIGLALNRLLN
ncbi:MAG: DUF3307 domain-containing protein [Chloroflexi bacterium]|nr:MAG: DUF3307 domain-containing protein [Chloroflexota bacterium]